MDKATFETADPLLDEIAEVANELLEAAEMEKLRSLLTKLNHALGKRYLVSLHLNVDPEQTSFLVQVSDYDKKPKGDPKILKTVKGLKKGDYVLLSWHHDYVTKDGTSSPQRPIVKLEKIDGDKANGLLKAPAAK